MMDNRPASDQPPRPTGPPGARHPSDGGEFIQFGGLPFRWPFPWPFGATRLLRGSRRHLVSGIPDKAALLSLARCLIAAFVTGVIAPHSRIPHHTPPANT